MSSDPYANEPKWVRFLTGGAASCTAEIATMPVDTTKVRLQMQREGHRVYKNMIDCFVKVIREEGPGGLYKGLTPALLRQASYSSLRMGIYEPIRNAVAGDTPVDQISYWQRLFSGGTAGAVGIAIANGTDLLKVRMQADRDGTRYTKGTFNAFKQIVQTEGVLGLWAGVGPNMQRAYIVNAAELATYDQAKAFIVSTGYLKETDTVTHFASSFAAGFMAALASNPVDLVKNRLMNQPAGPGIAPLYTSMTDCFRKTFKQEGFFGLYKGFVPNFMRIGPWCMVMFTTYEQFRIFAKSYVWGAEAQQQSKQ